MKKHVNEQFWNGCFALALLAYSRMFYTWNNNIYILLSTCFLFIYALFYCRKVKLNNFRLFNLLFLFMLVNWYALINGTNIFGLICIYISLIFVLLTPQTRVAVFEKLSRVYAVFVGISLFFFIVTVFYSLPFESEFIDPLNTGKTYGYQVFPFLVVPTEIGFLRFRFHGLFDEPGVVGSFSAIFLLANRYDFKKKSNIVILLTGLFSFSLFFYVITLFFYLASKPRNILIFVAIIFLLLFIFKDNELVENLILNRLDDGGIKNNRDTLVFKQIYDQFIYTSDFWFGVGPTPDNDPSVGGASYKRFIYYYGFIFFIMTCSFFLINAVKKIKLQDKKGIYCYLLIFLGMTFQRPFYYDIFYFFLLLASADILAQNRGITKAEKHNESLG